MRKMIIADDEQSALDLLDKILDWESLGIEIVGRAQDGREVLEFLKKNHSDILLTDIRMPELDGMELLDRIYEENMEIETIIVSAYDDFEYAQKALSFGIAGYILKPVDEEKLEDIIKKVLKQLDKKEEQNTNMVLFNKMAQNRILCKLLHPSNESEYLIGMLKRLNYNFPDNKYKLIVVQINYDSYKDITSFEDNGINGFSQKIQLVYHELESKNCILFDTAPEEWIILSPSSNEQVNTTNQVFRIISQISEEPGIECSIEISKTYSGLLNLHKAYSEAVANHQSTFSAIDPSQNLQLQNSPLVKKAIAFIEENFMQDLNLEEICSNSSVSKTYFCGLFKKEMGLSIWDYLTECRIREAQQLIKENELKNYEIAFRIGYENPGYFSKMFKRITGITPSEFRKGLSQ